MAGSITPLPIMQLEEEEDRKRYEALEAPKSIVVRYGYLKFIAELPYDGKDKPGCGSKMVIMTNRGVEMGEMLTTTCGNSGCGKSVSRKEMLSYIENSGGKDFPFTNQGKVVRVATHEDMKEQERLEAQKMPMIRFTKALVTELGLPMKLVDIEWLLGGERIIFHYTSESWVDFRELVKQLAAEYQTRIEMHQVNARDEARLVADYEKCGQQCCCKQFLKVLKPVSMRSAKVQKATLDPTKISGRCGRLMCCLRYEDQTYEDLRKRLPHRQTRVMTADGPGTVIDSQILTQLILIVPDSGDPPAAYPLENIEILTKDHPQFRQIDPRDQRDQRDQQGREPRRDRSGPSNRNDNRNNDSRGRGPDRGGDNRGGGDNRSGDNRGGRGPQRPRPGRPLEDNQVESREGQQSDQLPQDRQHNDHNGPRESDRPRQSPDARAPRQDQSQRSNDTGAPNANADQGSEAMDQNVGDQSQDQNPPQQEGQDQSSDQRQAGDGRPAGDGPRKRRRRRRRRGRGGNEGGQGPQASGPADPPSNP